MQAVRGRAILIVLLLLGSFVLLGRTVATRSLGEDGKLPTWLDDVLPGAQLNLGLDLQGGVHMVYEVELEKAAEGEVRHLADNLRRALAREDVGFVTVRPVGDEAVVVELHDEEDREAFEAVRAEYVDTELEVDDEETYGTTVTLRPDSDVLARRRDEAVQQAIEIIRNRIDEYGVSEPNIQKQGSRRILIQLPGVDDPSDAKDLISATAQLEFRLIDEEAEATTQNVRTSLSFDQEKFRSKEAARLTNQALAGRIPEGSEWLFQVERDKLTREIVRVFPRIVEEDVLLTGATLTDARLSFGGSFGTPVVSLEFDSEGARVFEEVTGANKGRYLAIVLGDSIYSAPVIRSRIAGGRAIIEGNFDSRSAQNLAIQLRGGSLPAPLTLLEERSVGPELGAESVRKGVISIVIGLTLVVIFMAVYYRLSGVVADVALMLNMTFLMAALAGFGATLTLPGIAGLILTVGMAVDANVLIFERIREELRAGKNARAAVEGGYAKALWTILDANITTLIAALVLFQFGTGPIRGFAVTLSVGVVTSVFTALVVTRVAFDYVLATRKPKALSI